MSERKPGRPRGANKRPEAKAFAANVRRLRLARGWTQRQLADESGVPLRSISNYERDREPYAFAAVKIAQALGTTVDALVGEENLQNNSD